MKKQQTTKPLAELYRELGVAMAAIIEHPDVPSRVYDLLGDLIANVHNSSFGAAQEKCDAFHARIALPVQLEAMGWADGATDEADALQTV